MWDSPSVVSELLLQRQTLNVGQQRCKAGTCCIPQEHVPCQGSEGFTSSSPSSLLLCICSSKLSQLLSLFLSHTSSLTRIMQVMLTFLVFTVNCLILTAPEHLSAWHSSALPQNTLAIFWPGHQASRGWLEMHSLLSIPHRLSQLFTQPHKQAA